MWSLLSVVAFLSIFESVTAQNGNEPTQNQTSNDIVGAGAPFARNLTASISVSDGADLSTKRLDVSSDQVNISDRIQTLDPAEKRESAVELNISNHVNGTGGIKMLDNFRPSQQLDTFYEFNKFPVKPAYPEAKTVPNYAAISSNDRNSVGRGDVLPVENEKSRTINVHGPPYFGNPNYNHLVGSKPEYPGPGNGPSGNSESSWTVQNGNTGESPWTSRVKFPTGPAAQHNNPYPFVESQKPGCCQENGAQPSTGPRHEHYLPPVHSSRPPAIANNAFLPPQVNKGEYLPPLHSNKPPEIPKNEYSPPEVNNGEYLPPVPNFSSPARGGSKERHTTGFGSSGPGEEFNFNKLVEIPKKFFSGGQNEYISHHKTYESPYNIMEKPSYEVHQKTHGGGYGNPWKKILKLLVTFIPIGLLISALTPTVITITNVNDTDNIMPPSRYRSDDSKKELHSHILSSLDYFDKLNEQGCEYRVFCELLVTASHMPDSESHVQNLLDNFAKQETDYKSRAKELKRVFEAVRDGDCNPISCEFIKNST